MIHRLFLSCKFHQKIVDIFLIFAQNIDFGYTLELPHQGVSNEYPQTIFWSKNKKNRYKVHTQVSGVKGGIHYTDIFPDVMTDDFFSYICSKKI